LKDRVLRERRDLKEVLLVRQDFAPGKKSEKKNRREDESEDKTTNN